MDVGNAFQQRVTVITRYLTKAWIKAQVASDVRDRRIDHSCHSWKIADQHNDETSEDIVGGWTIWNDTEVYHPQTMSISLWWRHCSNQLYFRNDQLGKLLLCWWDLNQISWVLSALSFRRFLLIHCLRSSTHSANSLGCCHLSLGHWYINVDGRLECHLHKSDQRCNLLNTSVKGQAATADTWTVSDKNGCSVQERTCVYCHWW